MHNEKYQFQEKHSWHESERGVYWFNNKRVEHITDFLDTEKHQKVNNAFKPSYKIDENSIQWIIYYPSVPYLLHNYLDKNTLEKYKVLIDNKNDKFEFFSQCKSVEGWDYVKNFIEEENKKIKKSNSNIERAEKLINKPSEKELKIIENNKLLIDNYLKNKNYKEALQLLENAASLGDIRAYHTMGMMHMDGLGTKVNYIKAKELFVKAANQRYLRAYGSLAKLYFDGLGVKKDYVLAYTYFVLASYTLQENSREFVKGVIENAAFVRDNFLTEFQTELGNNLIQECADKRFISCIRTE